MSVKRKSFSADFKAKLVLEVIEGEKTINEIASKYGVLPVSLKSWKKHFLENMSLAFDKSTVVKEYKDEIEELKKSKDAIAKKLGETIVDKEFLEGKLVSLASSKERKTLLDIKLNMSVNNLTFAPEPKHFLRNILQHSDDTHQILIPIYNIFNLGYFIKYKNECLHSNSQSVKFTL